MAGETFAPGEQKVRPGVYVRVTNTTPPSLGQPQGIVAVLFRSSWGPLGQVQTLNSETDVTNVFGSGGTTDALVQAFRGGANSVKGYRLGTGGAAATLVLKDTNTTPADVVTLTMKGIGVRGNNFTATVRDSLTDTSQRELLLYEGTTLRQKFTFAKGTGEPQALTDAVNNSGSAWITATKQADGNGTLAAISQQAFAGGTDPTVTTADYSTALDAIAPIAWDVLAIDSEDPSVHTTVQSYIDTQRNNGKRVQAVVGEPTSVDLATRQSDAKALNDFAMIYVLNGFTDSDGTTIEGYKAAARVAGMVASAPITASLTHAVVDGATDIVGALANSDIEASIQSGAIVFTLNSQGAVQIEYGINTYVTPDADHDDGWKKIRRVRTRDYLMDQIVAAWDPLVGKVNNDANGRATLIAAAQGVINQMIRDGALLDGTVSEDKNNPPSGDSAWFVTAVDDLDSAEKIYDTFAFRFAPPAAS
ncbi:MAG: phage tail sheath family protein [Alicyclobacillus macrosporangiidus]|uniref:phage tail sheath subtilisin-like domain-containing protein n=1 Tax=Alicyclobacillus macrosporangiidus TaxID=392015 RepID=UPI0026F0D0DC|nr:phage tail sheath subtilisin-like domain-containing protein [Alicyclobacillus macrosporangiidus]MCL6597942.1 phage tail sheath family protein [Alicyclobacillus macrosporangiidus]